MMNEKSVSTLNEKMISCDPVSKTVKGGRKRKFAVLMVVGDGKGTVGVGMGKSAEVPDAVSKAVQDGEMVKEYMALVHGAPPETEAFRSSRASSVWPPARSTSAR